MSARRIRLTIEYDGGAFAGWQKQARGESVQEGVERALVKVLKHGVTLHGAGRTDAGVHALDMVAHFDTANRMPADRLPLALAGFLPEGISVVAAEDAAADFDARGDAILRWYRYQIQLTRTAHPLGAHAWRVYWPLDRDKIRKALARLEGRHDFTGFRVSTCAAQRTLLTLEEASLSERGDVIAVDFKCRSFLQRMVRLMVGAIVGVGAGRLSIKELVRILDSGERPNTIRSAPAEGLCLMRIAYTAEEAENILTDHPPPPSF